MRLGALVAALLCAATTLGAAGEAPAAEVPVFAGETKIVGRSSGSSTLRLVRDVEIPVKQLHDLVVVNGRGRAYGVVVSGAETRNRDALVAVVNFAFCGRRCTAEQDGAGYGFFSADFDEESIELPRGLYTVALIADGSKTVAELRLPGLAGSTTLSPSSSIPSPKGEEVVISGEDTTTVYSGGSAFDVRSRVFSASALRLERTASAGGGFGACFYDEGEIPDAAAFAPGCPGGTNSLVADALIGPGFPTKSVFASALVFEEQGTAGHGNWYTGATIEKADAISVQVPLGP